jgi:hypothetical protein
LPAGNPCAWTDSKSVGRGSTRIKADEQTADAKYRPRMTRLLLDPILSALVSVKKLLLLIRIRADWQQKRWTRINADEQTAEAKYRPRMTRLLLDPILSALVRVKKLLLLIRIRADWQQKRWTRINADEQTADAKYRPRMTPDFA